MSLAWSGLVLLIVLLPGILFFVGMYLPEQFTREAEPRSPLGQLAGALLIAFALHGIAFAASGSFCGDAVPCISVARFLETVSYDPREAGSSDRIGAMLFRYRWWILAYVTLTSLVGVWLGERYGRLTGRRKIRGLSRHPWVYDLGINGLTYAHVLTHVRADERVLMYKGFLRAFGLQQDGRFSYLVLSDVTRLYLMLGADRSETSDSDGQRLIGSSSTGEIMSPSEPESLRRRTQSLFVIEGEDVANVVFDILETSAKPANEAQLRKIVSEEAALIGLYLSEKDIEDIIERSK